MKKKLMTIIIVSALLVAILTVCGQNEQSANFNITNIQKSETTFPKTGFDFQYAKLVPYMSNVSSPEKTIHYDAVTHVEHHPEVTSQKPVYKIVHHRAQSKLSSFVKVKKKKDKYTVIYPSVIGGSNKITGLAKYMEKWQYFKKGVKKNVTGLVKKAKDDGKYYYVQNGVWKKITGIAPVYGKKNVWRYVTKGVSSSKDDVVTGKLLKKVKKKKNGYWKIKIIKPAWDEKIQTGTKTVTKKAWDEVIIDTPARDEVHMTQDIVCCYCYQEFLVEGQVGTPIEQKALKVMTSHIQVCPNAPWNQ